MNTPMGMIDRFLEFAGGYNPQFANTIRGSTPEQIAILEQLVGVALPKSYREFLAALGENDGGLQLAFYGSTNINQVIGYYRELADGETSPPPPDCILIGTGDDSVGDVCLQRSPGMEPSVVISLDRKVQRLYAETLEKLLFRTVFQKYAFQKTPALAFYSGQAADALPSLAKAADEIGFQPLWFSDEVTFCSVKGAAVLTIAQFAGSGVTLRVGAASKPEAETIGNLFAKQGLVRFKQWLTVQSGS